MSGTAQPIPFSMPMFKSFVPERIRPWIYVFIAFTFQFSGGLYLGTLNQIYLFSFAVPYEIPLHQQDLVVWGSYRGIALQSGCTAYHFPTVAVAGMLHRRHVQDTRHVRVHVQHPTLDESDTRLYRVLPRAAYHHLRKYAVVRLACHLSDVLLPLGLHATVYLRHHDD